MIYPSDFEQKLGIDQVKERIKKNCLCTLAVNLTDQVTFQSDGGIIRYLLNQCNEFKQILEKGEEFPVNNYFDPTELFVTVSIEDSYIEEEEFYFIISSLRTIIACQQFLRNSKQEYPTLYGLTEGISITGSFMSSLASTFDDRGKIRDNASQDLQKIRKRLKEEEIRARRLSEQIFRHSMDHGWVPDGASPVIRDGKVVIPLLAEHKRRIKGFIVDESSTGQTIYLEPAEVLEINNEISDLFHSERREIIKILKHLTAILRSELPLLKNAYLFLGLLDFNRAKAQFALEIDAVMPSVSDEPDLNWRSARHPLLYLSLKGKRKVIPLLIDLLPSAKFLLVSGPNAGGKSVCLKTVGMIQYMAQCGLLVPMEEHSTLGIFSQIFLDIGDQQSLENDLSTYSSHLKNMSYFIGHANDSTLVLIDELGAGTDPNFGGGIAEAVLQTLLAKGVWGVATTHYYNLKLFASNLINIRNGAMLFDTQKLEPQFQLEIGKPGSSFALEIARKTGLPTDTIERAEQIIGKELTGMETLMKSLAEEKQQLERKQREFLFKEKELNDRIKKYQGLTSELDSKKKEIIEKAKSEASHLLKETNREIEKTIRHIRENKAEKKETRKVRAGLQELATKVTPLLPKKVLQLVELKEGDYVRIIGQEVSGKIVTLKGKSAVVEFGSIRSTMKTDQLVRSDQAETQVSMPGNRFHGMNILQKQASFVSTLDLRGKRAEEAGPIIDQFLDDAILLSQGHLKILHGKGEGVLRKIVREKLKTNKAVTSFSDEHADRGGDGLTLVVLK